MKVFLAVGTAHAKVQRYRVAPANDKLSQKASQVEQEGEDADKGPGRMSFEGPESWLLLRAIGSHSCEE